MSWIANAKMIDVRSGEVLSRHLEVNGDRITALSSTLPARREGALIDLEGAYLLPGLFDCHVHICADSRNPNLAEGWGVALPGTIALHAAANARRMLMAGITTARDVGGWDYHEIAVREAIRLGWIEGPRLLCAGRILSITSSSTHYWRGMYEEADGPDEVRKAARKQLASGADFIKVLATGAVASSEYENSSAVQLRADEIRAAVEVATDSLTYVAAHAHAPTGIQNAVNAGCRSIEHTVFGDEASYRLMAERGTFLVPTLCALDGLSRDPDSAALFPAHIRTRFEGFHAAHVANIQLARRLNVKIAMGSDAGAPGVHCGDNIHELDVMVNKAGFPCLEAIQSATIGAAALLRLDDQLGSLEVGKIADMIATRGNPLDDVGALHAVHFVMKEGRVVKQSMSGSGANR